MALIAIGFGRLVGDLGFGAAIIQFPALTKRHVRAAFTGSIFLGSLFFLILWFLAPAISRLFNQEVLIPMLRVIGLSLVVSGLSVISVALLRRELRFRTLTIIETVSYLVGFGGVGVSMAMLDYGAWSLVAANIVQPFCLLLLALYFGKQPFRPILGIQEYRDLARVASAEMLNNVVNFAASNLPFFAIGKWFGASALGLFNRSFHLMDLPVRHFSIALGSVMYPLYAKIQEDIPRLGRAFLHTVSLTSLVTVPLFFVMAAVPHAIIGGLFGEQWKPASTSFQILCVSGPFMAMMRVFGAVSHARGCVFSECGRQLAYLVIAGIALWLFFPLGLEGAAVAVSAAVIARYLLLAHLSVKLTRVRWRKFLLAQAPGYLLGIAVAVPVFMLSAGGKFFVLPDAFQLVLSVIVAISFVSIYLLIFPASWFGDFYPWALERFAPILPYWLQNFLTRKLSAAQRRVAEKMLVTET